MKLSGTIALSTKNLDVGYRDASNNKIILEGLNLEAKKGELICLMGQNGKGKSTLLRTLSGVQRPLNGQIHIGEELLSELKSDQISKLISLVLTDKPTAGNLSVKELILMGRYPYIGWNMRLTEKDIAIVNNAIECINLSAILDNKIFTLSDGQLQRVMIARALAQNGALLLLDEPTAHLDLNNRVEIMYLLSDLAKNTDKTIIMATHELDLALQMADRLWLVNNEGKVDVGVPEDLVLNGQLDAVFGHKGYNLKTGRIEHESEGKIVGLTGQGYAYLWTKNALERNGFIVEDNAEIEIKINEDPQLNWNVNNEVQAGSIEELLQIIRQ